jgi:pimeloyl-ACP methyl ester carboxylesterase
MYARLLLAASLAAGCRSSEPVRETAGIADVNVEAPPVVTDAAQAAKLPPLRDFSWLERLPLSGHGDGFVSVPLGAIEPRPVIVALHGSGDRPEWACGEWRGITNAYPFILCPHGTPARAPAGAGLQFAGAAATAREITAGLAALEARFGKHVAQGPHVLVGFSLGAMIGARIAADYPMQFPALFLVEGGHAEWNADLVTRFAEGGGQRVLFGCTTASCTAAVRVVRPRLDAAKIETHFVSAGNIGHLVDQRVVDALRPEFPWIVRGDARYAALKAP